MAWLMDRVPPRRDNSRFHTNSISMPAPPAPPAVFRRVSSGSKTSDGSKRVITRNRASYSCRTCRARKIKCDKAHPICSGCRKTNEQCLYSTTLEDGPATTYTGSSPEEARHGAKRRKGDGGSLEGSSEQTSPKPNESVPDPGRDQTVKDRLDRLTSLVEALSKDKDKDKSAPTQLSTVPGFGIIAEPADAPRPRRASVKYSNGDMWGGEPLHPIPSRHQQASKSHSAHAATPDLPPDNQDLPTVEAAELADPMSKMNLGYLSVQDGGRTRYVGSTFWAYVSDEIDQLNGLLRDQNRYSVSPARDPGSPSNLLDDTVESPTSDTSDDFQQHNSFHRAGDRAHHHRTALRSECAACHHQFSDKSILLQTLDSHSSRFRKMDASLVGVPTKTQSNILFRCWLSGVHGHIPLIYPPLVLKKYDTFWNWFEHDRQTGAPCPETPALPLLYAIWYAGSVSISLKGLRTWFPGTPRAKLSAGFHDQVTRSLALATFPRNASVPGLAAFLMTQMILAKEEEPITSSLYVSLAIRVAQNLGLHREPTLFNFPAWEVETRRRLWWQIVYNDCHIAIASGLPPLISDSYFDTKMISEVKDVKLGTAEANAYQEAVEKGERQRDNPDDPVSKDRKSMVSIHYVYARGKYVLARGLRRLLKIQLGTRSITKGDMQDVRRILSEVDHDLNEIIDRIPTKGIPEMGFTPEAGKPDHHLQPADHDPSLANQPTQEELRPFTGMAPKDGLNDLTVRYHWNTLIAFHKWTRIVLSMAIDKMYCVSYAPFLKSAKSKFWPAARQCALRHCHGYMRKFISLATNATFQPFHWSWPGMHQPMHAAMIMLVDLYERPNSVEAPRSRAFIDKIFSMSGPDGGIVSGEDGVTVQRPLREGGREAWDMLRRLREKAWQRAGLDPDVLWTEDDQIKAGVAQPLTDEQKVAQSLREDTIHDSTGRQTHTDGDSVVRVFDRAVEQSQTLPASSTQPGKSEVHPARPKTLQRVSTVQQKTPFRSPAQRRTSRYNLNERLAFAETQVKDVFTSDDFVQGYGAASHPASSTAAASAQGNYGTTNFPLIAGRSSRPSGWSEQEALANPRDRGQMSQGRNQMYQSAAPDYQPPQMQSNSTNHDNTPFVLDIRNAPSPPPYSRPFSPLPASSSEGQEVDCISTPATSVPSSHLGPTRDRSSTNITTTNGSAYPPVMSLSKDTSTTAVGSTPANKNTSATSREQDHDHEQFDWAQWDAVFGSTHHLNAGFEDMMGDDVDMTWEESHDDPHDDDGMGTGRRWSRQVNGHGHGDVGMDGQSEDVIKDERA